MLPAVDLQSPVLDFGPVLLLIDASQSHVPIDRRSRKIASAKRASRLGFRVKASFNHPVRLLQVPPIEAKNRQLPLELPIDEVRPSNRRSVMLPSGAATNRL